MAIPSVRMLLEYMDSLLAAKRHKKETARGITLMGPQGDFRVHTGKADMVAIVGTGPDCVVEFVILPAQIGPTLRVFPYPAFERLLYLFLLLLGQHGFLDIQHPFIRTVRVVDCIVNPGIPQI